MSTQAISDFLTKQLFIEKNVVTYRSLSREFAIHVNAAKNELLAYHKQVASESHSRVPPAATYLITGEKHSTRSMRLDDSQQMDIDEVGGDVDSDVDADADVPEVCVLLVTESELEDAKSQFQRIYAVHVYCLSPSPIHDAGLVCSPTDHVRQVDGSQKGLDMSSIVGRVVSKEIKMKAGIVTTRVASSSKGKHDAPTASTSTKQIKKDEPKESKQEQPPVKKDVKPKATGKLDFSKAKTKEEKRAEAEASSSKVKAEKTLEDIPKTEAPKRGVKRKSVGPLPSDTESNMDISSVRAKSTVKKSGDKAPRATKPRKSLKTSMLSDDEDSLMSDIQSTTKNGAKIKKGVVLSDDDEPLPPSRRKLIRKETEAERSLREMMEIDDDQVTRVSRSMPSESEEVGDTVNEDEDLEMTDNTDMPPATKPKRKRVKKVVPVGRNGLKKRRLVKSRMKVDEKGYMVTEDYSSYESVDEEEPEPEPKKTKGTGKNKPSADKTRDNESIPSGSTKVAPKKSAPAAKPVARKNGGAAESTKSSGGTKLGQKGSIANFFGPAKNK